MNISTLFQLIIYATTLLSFIFMNGYFVKKWINGTSEKIKALEENKVGCKEWKESKEKYDKLFDLMLGDLANVSQFVNKIKEDHDRICLRPWDAQ